MGRGQEGEGQGSVKVAAVVAQVVGMKVRQFLVRDRMEQEDTRWSKFVLTAHRCFKRLQAYTKAYGLDTRGAIEKEDFVQTIVKSRSAVTGCLSPEAESYYRRRSVPKQGVVPIPPQVQTILYENHVKVDFSQVLEKTELVGRVAMLVAEERRRLERQRAAEEAEERAEAGVGKASLDGPATAGRSSPQVNEKDATGTATTPIPEIPTGPKASVERDGLLRASMHVRRLLKARAGNDEGVSDVSNEVSPLRLVDWPFASVVVTTLCVLYEGTLTVFGCSGAKDRH
ncbi:hypothetical protein QFC19_002826 [Naganishia cerealis]|uniref:Uncharacterized protein n=1 Tax=Naganishia cerealis TaxID=610337 RepID=A0ACC2W6V2_9TREE|nr:hypothetical protein QFC19_002826 [Naganishia cerealis]